MVFDAREPLQAQDPSWSDARRAQYLLRTDVVKPLSVDKAVWPNVFAADVLPTWTGRLGLWDDLSHLQQFVGARAHQLLRVSSGSDQVDGWSLLGFDVADQWLVSGLSNCGYGEEEDVSALRASWAPHLNRHHLFDDFERAVLFAKLSDARVAEHAPFMVFGMWVPANHDAAPFHGPREREVRSEGTLHGLQFPVVDYRKCRSTESAENGDPSPEAEGLPRIDDRANPPSTRRSMQAAVSSTFTSFVGNERYHRRAPHSP